MNTPKETGSAVSDEIREHNDATGSLFGKLIPLIGLLALALLGWMFIKGGRQRPAPANSATVESDASNAAQQLEQDSDSTDNAEQP